MGKERRDFKNCCVGCEKLVNRSIGSATRSIPTEGFCVYVPSPQYARLNKRPGGNGIRHSPRGHLFQFTVFAKQIPLHFGQTFDRIRRDNFG